MKQLTRIKILDRFHQEMPNPKPELNFSNDFELLIAVILSAQATDKSVNKATDLLFKLANSPEKMLQLGLEKLKLHIKTIGLYNAKANNIIKTCKILIDKYQGKVPNTFELLEQLPGVGRKTANVVLNLAFKQPTIAVDTHIFRVSNRTKFATGKDVLAVENKLLKVVPDKYKLNTHHWLILHGRYVCQARKPRCGSCLIEDLCEYAYKTE